MSVRSYGITGGIGSGKSYVCRLIEQAGGPVFYCDDVAKRIIATDPDVRRQLTTLVGKGVYTSDGHLQKSVLSAWICRGDEAAKQVDAIVHPKVAAAFEVWKEQQSTEKVYMECALLWESGFNRLVDCTVLVSAPDDVRLVRVMQRDHISEAKARQWMQLQMPEEEKKRRADIVITNIEGQPINLSPIL